MANLTHKKEEIVELLNHMELGLVRDHEMRKHIRFQLEKRLKWGYEPTHEQQLAQLLNLVQSIRQMEVGSELESKFTEVAFQILQLQVGSTFKESCCYFKDELTTLDEAEIAMLDLYTERAQIKDGQSILDLECGMGSIIIYVAKKYGNCNVTGTTKSLLEKEFIEKKCKELKLSNVKVILAALPTLEMEDTFDRVFGAPSHEMKNHELFLKKISKWMKDDGLLFIEHDCHKTFAYLHKRGMVEETG